MRLQLHLKIVITRSRYSFTPQSLPKWFEKFCLLSILFAIIILFQINNDNIRFNNNSTARFEKLKTNDADNLYLDPMESIF